MRAGGSFARIARFSCLARSARSADVSGAALGAAALGAAAGADAVVGRAAGFALAAGGIVRPPVFFKARPSLKLPLAGVGSSFFAFGSGPRPRASRDRPYEAQSIALGSFGGAAGGAGGAFLA